MKAKDKISENYRKQVDELLDNKSDLNLSEPLSQEELDEVWEEISTEIDLGEVWSEISSDLDVVMPVDTSYGIFAKAIVALIIILICMIPVKKAIIDSQIVKPDNLIENRQNEQSEELIDKNISEDPNIGDQPKLYSSPVLNQSLNAGEEGNKPTTVESNRTDLTQKTLISISNEVPVPDLSASETTDSNLVISPDNNTIEKSNILKALFPDDLRKINLFSKTGFDSLKIDRISSTSGHSLPLIDRGRISGGFITLFKNTWLLNHETLDGLKSESLNSSEIVFFPDVGLSLNYSLSKTWLIQADGFFFSNTGQDYLEYLYGHYSRKKITLSYSEIALSVKYKFTGSSRLIPRSSINILAGGYFSVLNHANQKIGTDLENIGSQYEKFDFGVRLGSEFELRIFDKLSVAPGLLLSLGIPNIYKGTPRIPGYLIRTHNGSAEFHFAFYYHFN